MHKAGDQAQPILGNQPPLLRAIVVSYIQPEETNQESYLVPIGHYGGEVRDMYMGPTSSYKTMNEPSNIIPEERYQMNHNTLWFIANGMQSQQGQMGP